MSEAGGNTATIQNVSYYTYFRCKITSAAGCVVYSNSARVTPVSDSVGGTITGPDALCATANNLPAGTYTVSGYTGNILRWEWSTNNTTWNEFGAGVTTTTSPAGTIGTGNFYVRVVVQNGTCGAVYSSTKVTRIDPHSVGGTVNPANQTICATQGIVPTQHTLSGQNGTVVRWEWTNNNGATWNDWGGGGSATASGNCCFTSVGTWQVRAIIQNGACPAVASSVGNIIVVADPSVSISGGTTICSGGTATLTSSVSGGTGTTTYQWQSRTDNVTFADILGATSAAYTPPSVSASVRYYRVNISQTDNGCGALTLAVSMVTIVADPSSSVSLPTATVCVGGTTTMTTTIANGVGCSPQWQNSTNGGTTWNDISGAIGNSYTTPTLTTPIKYRVKLVCTGNGCCN